MTAVLAMPTRATERKIRYPMPAAQAAILTLILRGTPGQWTPGSALVYPIGHPLHPKTPVRNGLVLRSRPTVVSRPWPG